MSLFFIIVVIYFYLPYILEKFRLFQLSFSVSFRGFWKFEKIYDILYDIFFYCLFLSG